MRVFAKAKPGPADVVLKFSHAKNRSIKMASDRQREALFVSVVAVTGGHLCVCSTQQHKLLTFMISHKQNRIRTLHNNSLNSSSEAHIWFFNDQILGKCVTRVQLVYCSDSVWGTQIQMKIILYLFC